MCVMLFYISYGIQNAMASYDLFATMEKLFGFPNQYYLLFFFVSAYILIEYCLKMLDIHIRNNIEESLFIDHIKEKEAI